MITAVALAGYALLLGAVVPYALARARWAHRAPVAALLAWQGLTLAFVVTAALAAYHLVLSDQHVHDGLTGLLSACGLGAGAPAAPAPGAGALAAPAAMVLLPLGRLAHTAWQARRERRSHAGLLAMIGTESARYGATVVEYPVPAVYCLPGRDRRIVVTRGALEALSGEQLRAVLAHEEAHLRGRHHLLQVATKGFARAFPGLPLARLAREQTALLLEMAADDRALRSHSRTALASAMCEVAAGRAPRGALGAGGQSVLIRLHRILTPQAGAGRAAWPAAAASVAAPLLPLLLTCGPV
ncbi:M56 family metallopeptidase [Streptomyces sp. CAU 1734]|uniref:M56 family metallopeptidase n=1 Tax=Streptomyces sp. CAU 1734 TaxID=3140360 RepID=UPI0032602148